MAVVVYRGGLVARALLWELVKAASIEDGHVRSNRCRVKGAGTEHARSDRAPLLTTWRAVNARLFIMLSITNRPVGQSNRARTKSNRHD